MISHISHNAPFCNRNVHMCTFLLQKGALWDMGLVHCGICEMGLFAIVCACGDWLPAGRPVVLLLATWHPVVLGVKSEAGGGGRWGGQWGEAGGPTTQWLPWLTQGSSATTTATHYHHYHHTHPSLPTHPAQDTAPFIIFKYQKKSNPNNKQTKLQT